MVETRDNFASWEAVAVQEVALSFGGLQPASRRAGLSANALQTMRDRGVVSQRTLSRCLARLELAPLRFYEWVYGVYDIAGGGSVLTRFGTEALDVTLRSSEPAASARLRRAWVQDRLPVIPLAPAAKTRLAALDELRYDDRPAAVRRAQQLVERAEDAESAARGLGVWAAALGTSEQRPKRLALNLKRSQGLLWTGLRLAGAARLPRVVGDLLQRAASLVRTRTADLDMALELAELAEATFVRCEDEVGVGEALVTQGLMLRGRGERAEAAARLERGLPLLGPRSLRHQASALQMLSALAIDAGALVKADRLAQEALGLRIRSRADRARLHWLRGRLASSRQDWTLAIRAYEAAIDLLGDAVPIDTALVAKEAVRVLLLGGRVRDARTLLGGVQLRQRRVNDQLSLLERSIDEHWDGQGLRPQQR